MRLGLHWIGGVSETVTEKKLSLSLFMKLYQTVSGVLVWMVRLRLSLSLRLSVSETVSKGDCQ